MRGAGCGAMRRRIFTVGVLVVAAAALPPVLAHAGTRAPGLRPAAAAGPVETYDARRAATLRPAAAPAALRASLGVQAVVQVDRLTGTPRQVARLDGLLTGPSAAPAATVALGY